MRDLSQTVRAKAVRALLKALDEAPEPHVQTMDSVLVNCDGEPRLYVYKIVDIVIDSITKTMREGESKNGRCLCTHPIDHHAYSEKRCLHDCGCKEAKLVTEGEPTWVT